MEIQPGLVDRAFVMYFVERLAEIAEPQTIGLKLDVGWSDRISNSHSSPQNGVQNFNSSNNLPRGYPGWSGRVWIRYAQEARPWGSDSLLQVLLHTGTGGAGAYGGPWQDISSDLYAADPKRYNRDMHLYSWDCKIWASDHPELWDLHRQMQETLELDNAQRAIQGENPLMLPKITWCWQSQQARDYDREFYESRKVPA